MKALHFTKIESIGNHFVLIDAMDMMELEWPTVAKKTCTYRSGVGADGLLVILPSEIADFRMRMFNPDGTEDACGNGLRCAAVFNKERMQKKSDSFTIEAIDGIHEVETKKRADGSTLATIDMGEPLFGKEDIPTLLEVEEAIDYPLGVDDSIYNINCVRVGSPHTVIFAPLSMFWENIPDVSERIENHKAFPDRISVTWCSVETADELKVRTWERAVGPTLGCGTGACSAVVAASIKGISKRIANVSSPGGTLIVDWQKDGNIKLTGTARIVFDGEFSIKGA